MKMLQIASCMAENAMPICRAMAEYIGRHIDHATCFMEGVPWQDVETLLDRGKVDLCWICGLPYAWKSAVDDPTIELCVVPVMQGARYQQRPVYFSDIVVHWQSEFRTFADLRGAAWTYNEPRSHSGFNVVRHHLATLGEKSGYFGSAVESGAHQLSLGMILNHEVDASAIDSTVLEAELRRSPWLRDAIRIVETLGPSPMPPWVINRNLPAKLKNAVTGALLDMHTKLRGRRILESWGISHFAIPDKNAYAPILNMARAAAGVRLALN